MWDLGAFAKVYLLLDSIKGGIVRYNISPLNIRARLHYFKVVRVSKKLAEQAEINSQNISVDLWCFVFCYGASKKVSTYRFEKDITEDVTKIVKHDPLRWRRGQPIITLFLFNQTTHYVLFYQKYDTVHWSYSLIIEWIAVATTTNSLRKHNHLAKLKKTEQTEDKHKVKKAGT